MVTPDQIPTIFRDEAYKAFLEELPTQAEEMNEFNSLFETESINGYVYYDTEVFGSNTDDVARNPGEPMNNGTMGQAYSYFTAVRAEFQERRTILDEYLQSTLKLGDFAAEQGALMARNYVIAQTKYFTRLFSLGGIVPATLAATGNGSPGRRPGARIFNHALKGQAGAVIAECPNTDAADPDGKGWFAYVGNEHIRSNGDTVATFDGKTLGYFNAGSSVSGGNLILSEPNISAVLLHMENDLPYGPDQVFYAAPMADTIVVSGNLRVRAEEIFNLNEYRLNTPNNDKNTVYKSSGIFKLKNVIVNRYLPDNCWYLGKKGTGLKKVLRKGKPMSEGFEGPVKGSVNQISYDSLGAKAWVNDLLCFWSHKFDSHMDFTWYAGSTPTTISAGKPVAPTAVSLVNWAA